MTSLGLSVIDWAHLTPQNYLISSDHMVLQTELLLNPVFLLKVRGDCTAVVREVVCCMEVRPRL